MVSREFAQQCFVALLTTQPTNKDLTPTELAAMVIERAEALDRAIDERVAKEHATAPRSLEIG